jgi:hypothetical protein
VLDLGSGLPTQGHFNTQMPDAKILFADSDPLSVVQGQQLLAYTSDMAYCHVDVRDVDAVIREATAYFGDERRIAVGCIGIVYFLDDDKLRELMRRLHDFCAPGSALAMSWPLHPDTQEVRDAIMINARHAGIEYYNRSQDRIAELVAPWRAHHVANVSGRSPGSAPGPARASGHPERVAHHASPPGPTKGVTTLTQ